MKQSEPQSRETHEIKRAIYASKPFCEASHHPEETNSISEPLAEETHPAKRAISKRKPKQLAYYR